MRLVERREKTLFEKMQSRSKISLQTEQIGPLAIGVGSLDSEYLTERLCLKTRAGNLPKSQLRVALRIFRRTEKLTMVTRDTRSAGKSTEGSLVERNILENGRQHEKAEIRKGDRRESG